MNNRGQIIQLPPPILEIGQRSHGRNTEQHVNTLTEVTDTQQIKVSIVDTWQSRRHLENLTDWTRKNIHICGVTSPRKSLKSTVVVKRLSLFDGLAISIVVQFQHMQS